MVHLFLLISRLCDCCTEVRRHTQWMDKLGSDLVFFLFPRRTALQKNSWWALINENDFGSIFGGICLWGKKGSKNDVCMADTQRPFPSKRN